MPLEKTGRAPPTIHGPFKSCTSVETRNRLRHTFWRASDNENLVRIDNEIIAVVAGSKNVVPLFDWPAMTCQTVRKKPRHMVAFAAPHCLRPSKER